MAWPLKRALIENLIHVKEDTRECVYSGKISQTSNRPLSDCALWRTPRPAIWRECGSLWKQNWMLRLVTFRVQVSAHVHTHKHTGDRWRKLLPPCHFLVSDVKSKHLKKKKKRQCSRERGGKWLIGSNDVIFKWRDFLFTSSQREEGGTHAKRKLAKCALRPYKGTAELNDDTGDPPRWRRRWNPEAASTWDAPRRRWDTVGLSGFARVEKHCRQLWTEGCETAAVIKGNICICVNQAEGVSQQSWWCCYLGEHKMSQQQNAWKGKWKSEWS